MAGRALSFRDWVRLIGALLLALVLIAALRWRHDIVQATLDPKVPFQTYRRPPAPDYSAAMSWALLPAQPATWTAADPPADVFFVHPTTFDGGRDWNGPIDDDKANRLLRRTMLPNYAEPFARVGRIFAPRYRQASLYTALTLRDDARDARKFAYGDVRRAFDEFLDHFNQGRPLIVVGVEQGGTLVDRLMREELAARPTLIRRLVAVYVIDATVLAADHGPNSALPACAGPGEPRCMIAWNQEFAFDQADIREVFERSLVWGPDDDLDVVAGRPILCVNPLLGAQSNAVAPARLNRGAVAASDIEPGARPAFLGRQVSAQCVDGVLRVSAPRSPSLRVQGDWLERLKEPAFNLFYADEETDAAARLAGLAKAPGYAPPTPTVPAPPAPVPPAR
ncbi:MAG TPA: DUF3089 domain-containing protein [Caulobacteraceae bacterium]|jgi:hypothetical protein|nr:DUF3089 domain-containing protein [Caulobacteraceae bacterium]